MTRAIETFACAVVALACAACGGDDPATPPPIDERGWAPDQPGLFGFRRVAPRTGGIGEIGYAQGTEDAPAATGVVRRDPKRAHDGLNLMCSGDEASAVLVDMDGDVVHRWALPYEDLPDAPSLEGPHQIPWRRVHLLPDGGLLAIHSGRALVRVDRDSSLAWVRFDRVHHDLDVAADGAIVALSRIERIVPEVNASAPIVDDLVANYGADGSPGGTLSLWDAFARSRWASMLDLLTVREGDVMHANSIDLLDEDEARRFAVEAVRPGHALICMRDLDLVVVCDLDAGELVWLTQGAGDDLWRAPHDPSVAADGSILIFDNRGGPGETSRLLRLDPRTTRVEWEWRGDPPASFASFFCGTAQELPNGNVLATESTQGRAIEVDPATGDVVWEYVSDRVVGPNGEYVAALFDVVRVAPPAWLDR